MAERTSHTAASSRVDRDLPVYDTDRLQLRPGRPENARALFSAIADRDIVRNLSSAPWPYSLSDAEKLASLEFDPENPRLFLFRKASGPTDLIGVAALDRMPTGEMELGYWIAKKHWNKGYATEAGRQMIEIARTELKLAQLVAGYFIDNPLSARVLHKLGFVATAGVIDRNSLARGGPAPCQMCTLDL